MKALTSIVILLFLAFLSAPTLVSLLQEEDENITVVDSLDEEEVQKEIKQLKLNPHWVYEAAFIPLIKKSTRIQPNYLRRHESNAFGDIFIPPPERA